MKSIHFLFIYITFLFLTLSLTFAQNANETNLKNEEASKKDQEKTKAPYKAIQPKALIKTNAQKVLVIPIHGTVEPGLSAFVKRNLDTHGKSADLIILDVDTLGGRVDSALEIKDALLAQKTPVIAYINRRAISAGALISFAADYIVFADAASMGAATPIHVDSDGSVKAVEEKMVSYFRTEMRTTAEANGWDGILAEAMVDAEVEISGVIEKGKLLTVTNTQALKLGLCNEQINSFTELVTKTTDSQPLIINAEENWAEILARFITDPAVAGFLMSIGMLGLMIEFYTPGFGLAGAVGFIAISLFFGGHMIVNLADSMEITIFFIGLILLLAEIFIIPGFGFTGISGIVLIALSMILAMAEMREGGLGWEIFADATYLFTLSFGITILSGLVIISYLPKTRFASFMVLEQRLEKAEDLAPSSDSLISEFQAGMQGISMTALRKYGTAKFLDKTVEVVSESEYIEANENIEIIKIHNQNIIVKKIRS
jgi:membrane-bound serine protease (ClpP class)